MRIRSLFGVTAFAFGIAAAAQQKADTAVYIASYVEVDPSAERTAVALLTQYRDASRKEPGNLRLDALQQIGRANHFAIVEAWRDGKSFDAHKAAAHTKDFAKKLDAVRVSPYDERTHEGITLGSAADAPSAEAVYVVTHVDTIPPGQDEVRNRLKTLAGASRKESGNLSFDLLQGVRPNHFTVVETWRTQKAAEAHASAAETRQFRDQAGRLSTNGAPYDERWYKAVR